MSRNQWGEGLSIEAICGFTRFEVVRQVLRQWSCLTGILAQSQHAGAL